MVMSFEHKFHGFGCPPGGILEKNNNLQTQECHFFEDRLLSHSDTGFRIYVKN